MIEVVIGHYYPVVLLATIAITRSAVEASGGRVTPHRRAWLAWRHQPIEGARLRHLRQVLAVAAMLALAAGDAADAMRWTERAHAVHASPAVRALHALVSAALRSDEHAPQSGATTR